MKLKRKSCIVVAVFLCVILLGTILSVTVFADSSADISIENVSESTSGESLLGKSPLVEEADKKAEEEAKLEAEDDSSEFVKYFKNLYKNTSNSFNRNFIENDGWKLLLKGLLVTLEVTFFAVILGILLGFLIGIIRSVHDKTGGLNFLNSISKLYITIIRGTPVVVQLLIINFVIFQSVNISKVLVAVIAFGVNSGAYVAEIFRSGIMSVDNGQMEAGRSLGLTYSQSMRSIIMPQAFKNVLPALGNEFIVLLKETSVCGYIALEDLNRAGEIIKGNTYDAFWPLIGVAVIYLVVVMGLTKLLTLLERRMRKSDSR